MKQYIVSGELMNWMSQYLGQRPHDEVDKGLALLRQSKEHTEEIEEVIEGKLIDQKPDKKVKEK